jgi:hypothetical protein
MFARVVLAALIGSGFALADDPFDRPAKKAAEEKAKVVEPKGLIPLIRFYHKTQGEHLYAAGEDEAAALRSRPELVEQQLVGHVLSAEAPKARRLWHAEDGRGRHYFYLQAKQGGPKLTVHREPAVFVWTEKGAGLVPVYGSVLADGGDLFLDPDPVKVRKVAEEALTGLGVKRVQLTPAFYVYDRDAAKTPVKKK